MLKKLLVAASLLLSVPAFAQNVQYVTPVTITTSHANTVLLGGYKMSSVASPTAGSGWTAAYGANFFIFEYQIVSSASTYTATLTTGTGDQNAGIGDATY